jgi:hypothetical protein
VRRACTDIADAFVALPPQGNCAAEFWQYETATVYYRGHVRTEHFTLESTTALNHFRAFPDVAQVIRRDRRVRNHLTKALAVSSEFLVTSLDRQRVTLAQIEQV